MRLTQSLFCLVLALTPCLTLAAPAARGIDPASDWQSRIDRELSKMREEAARLHEEGDKLWNTGNRREGEGSRSAEENDKQVQTDGAAGRQKQGDDAYLYQSTNESSTQQHASGEQNLPQDNAESVLLLTRAAEQGDARAQCALGTMYATGQGMPKDEVKAVQLYEKAARQEHADAQYALGWMYAHGRGVPRDEVKAVQWCLKAAEQGMVTHASCQNLRRTAK